MTYNSINELRADMSGHDLCMIQDSDGDYYFVSHCLMVWDRDGRELEERGADWPTFPVDAVKWVLPVVDDPEITELDISDRAVEWKGLSAIYYEPAGLHLICDSTNTYYWVRIYGTNVTFDEFSFDGSPVDTQIQFPYRLCKPTEYPELAAAFLDKHSLTKGSFESLPWGVVGEQRKYTGSFTVQKPQTPMQVQQKVEELQSKLEVKQREVADIMAQIERLEDQ